jgi:endonuclease/exonuclease/phosphatase family metal-dependent hydrolase
MLVLFLKNVDVGMDVWSLNLSWATQLNVQAGSERDFVAGCQEQWGRDTKSKGPHDVPSCTRTALELVAAAKPDIVCLQELASRKHAQWYAAHFFGPAYWALVTSAGKAVVMTLVSKSVVPSKPTIFAEANLATKEGDVRPGQLLRLLPGVFLANVHLGHAGKKGQQGTARLVEFLEDHLAAEKPSRLIVAGDLNTAKPKFGVLGMKFSGSGKPKTCCHESGVWRAGDYILDSEPAVEPTAVPEDWPSEDELRTSDHVAVHAVLKALESASSSGSESESTSDESESENESSEAALCRRVAGPQVLGLVKAKKTLKGKRAVWVLSKGQVTKSMRASKSLPAGLHELTQAEAQAQAQAVVECGLESDSSWVQVGRAWLGQQFLGKALFRELEGMDSDDEPAMLELLKHRLSTSKWRGIREHVTRA